MNKPKLALFLISARGGGDSPPLVALAHGLRERGYHVLCLCDSATEPLVRRTGISTIPIRPDLEQDAFFARWIADLPEGGELNEGTPNPLIVWASTCAPWVRDALGDRKPDLLLSSLFCMGLADALGRDTGAPWCFVNPSFYFGDGSSRSWEDDFFGLNVWFFRDCCLPLVRRADLVLHATDSEFDFQSQALPANHHYVGFLLWEPKSELPEWLRHPGDPFALVTVSSVPQDDEPKLAATALHALANRPVRTVLTLAPEHERQELGEIPNNARLEGFVPHTPVLQRSKILVSHAGHGIVSKALYNGVPMVLLPWDRDQPGVAARAEQLGVAAVVPRTRFNREEVESAVAAIFDNSELRETAKRTAERLQSSDAVAKACKYLGRL
jgi:UDP:flavonoid glycosyltransferase YjiC (YdhE family)